MLIDFFGIPGGIFRKNNILGKVSVAEAIDFFRSFWYKHIYIAAFASPNFSAFTLGDGGAIQLGSLIIVVYQIPLSFDR